MELLHKSRDFSTNISSIKSFFVKVSFQKVISSKWFRMENGKLCGITLKVYQVQNKPNLDNIFKLYLSYHDLEGLCNSPDYFQRLRKKLFAMIRQFGLPRFFVIFTSTKILWDPFIKAFHTLHASKLNLSNKLKDLQSVHIT
jgi:hypothetical protein